jgi:hypothetical protein
MSAEEVIAAVLRAIRGYQPALWWENGRPHATDTTGFVRIVDALIAECEADAT